VAIRRSHHRRSHHVSWQGDGGDDDEAEEVNGYGPLGSVGGEMPTEFGGGRNGTVRG
jgi:hypothetical protein